MRFPIDTRLLRLVVAGVPEPVGGDGTLARATHNRVTQTRVSRGGCRCAPSETAPGRSCGSPWRAIRGSNRAPRSRSRA
jgi:hypothetical protein